jgi:hypothetical protein
LKGKMLTSNLVNGLQGQATVPHKNDIHVPIN